MAQDDVETERRRLFDAWQKTTPNTPADYAAEHAFAAFTVRHPLAPVEGRP